jgi:hypothetical protein
MNNLPRVFGKATGVEHKQKIAGLGFLSHSPQRVVARYGESCSSASTTTQLLLLFSHNSFKTAEAQFLQFPEPLIENLKDKHESQG